MASKPEITLYNSKETLCSKKMRMVFHEKHIPFMDRQVSVEKGENYEPWFLRINPPGLVPVMQVDSTYLPDSEAITEYLEKKFGPPYLIPYKAENFEEFQCLRVKVNEMVASCMLLYRFDFYKRDGRIKEIHERARSKSVEKNELAELYKRKVEKNEATFKLLESKEEFEKSMSQTKTLMDSFEERLTKDEWLFGNSLTLVDITLTVILQRLRYNNLAEVTWDNDEHPNLRKYFNRLSSRDSFITQCLDS